MIVRDKLNESTTSPQVGPGKYENVPFRKTSYNFGQVPFGVSNDRFRYETYEKPGPGSYESQVLQFQKPKISVDDSKSIDPNYKTSQYFFQTSSFKSKIPKISIYQEQEKRLRSMNEYRKHKENRHLHLTEELDKDEVQTRSSKTAKGRIMKGHSMFQSKKSQSPSLNKSSDNDLFGVSKLNQTGPADYQVKVEFVQKHAPVAAFPKQERYGQQSLKKQMESYLGNILGKDEEEKRKLAMAQSRINNSTQYNSFSEKPLSSLISKSKRDNPYIRKDLPGPGQYNIKDPKYVIDHVKETPFGSTVKRDIIINRDMSTQPYTNPSRCFNPSPDSYQRSKQLDYKKQILRYDELKQTSSFASNVQRSILNTVNKDATENPGPGDYESVNLEKIHYQGENRFDGRHPSKPSINTKLRVQKSLDRAIVDQDNLADNLSHIGVYKRKEAIREAISLIKERQKVTESSPFKSKVERFKSIEARQTNDTSFLSQLNVNKTRDQTQSDFNKQRFSQTIYVQKPGFLNKSPRHSFVTQVQRKSETPGPGYYKNQQELAVMSDYMKKSSGVGGFLSLSKNNPSYLPGKVQDYAKVGPGSYNQVGEFTKQSFNKANYFKKVFI